MQNSRLAGNILSYCALLHRSVDLLQQFKGAPKRSDNPVLLQKKSLRKTAEAKALVTAALLRS